MLTDNSGNSCNMQAGPLGVMAPRVFIGVGSNLLDPQAQVIRALALLDREAGISLLVHSRLYRTSPWGRLEQPAFVNAVAEVGALQRPSELLELLKDLESRLGRSSGRVPWGPRIIDLDLLAFGDQRLTEPSLRLLFDIVPGVLQVSRAEFLHLFNTPIVGFTKRWIVLVLDRVNRRKKTPFQVNIEFLEVI